MTTLYYLNQYISKTLDTTGGIDASQTADIQLSDVTDLDVANPGIAIISYSDPLDTSKAEWITYTSINAGTKKFVGVTRGQEGYSAKAHAKGVTIAFPISKSHINLVNDLLTGVTAGAYMKEARVTPRTTTEASSATPTINTDNTDIHTITALAAAITSMTTNLSGTPVNGQKLIIRIKDNGTARAITWGASFASRGATLPTTTVLGKYQYNGFLWNSTTSTWDCVVTMDEE